MKKNEVSNIVKIHSNAEDILKNDFHVHIEDGVLPIIDLDYNKEHTRQEERAKNIYRAFRKGKVGSTVYVLPEDYKLDIVHNHVTYDPAENKIKPNFTITITIYTDDVDVVGEKKNNFTYIKPDTPSGSIFYPIHTKIQDKFDSLGIHLVMK